MTNRLRLIAMAAAATMLGAMPGHATYFVDTGLSTTTPQFGVDTNYSLSPVSGFAAYVTFTSNVTIESIEAFFDDSSSAVTMAFYADGAAPAGAALFSGTFNKVGVPDQYGYEGLYGQSIALAAGSYWLEFSTSRGTGMWNVAGTPLENYAFKNVSGWNAASYLNLAVRIGGTIGPVVTNPVPEPASWAMMIGGLALTGAMMRKRTRQTVRFA